MWMAAKPERFEGVNPDIGGASTVRHFHSRWWFQINCPGTDRKLAGNFVVP